MTIGIYTNEESAIFFYGEKAGKVDKDAGIAYIKHKYRCGELLHVLDTWNLKPAWIPNENIEHLLQIGDLLELTDGTVCTIDTIDSGTDKFKTTPWGEDYHYLFESNRTGRHCHQWFRAYEIKRLILAKIHTKAYVCKNCGRTHYQLEQEHKTICPACAKEQEQRRINQLQAAFE